MSIFISVAFVINAKSRYFTHFACFVIAHCRTFVLPASRFLACVHFRSSYQRVDFIDTLRLQKYYLQSVGFIIQTFRGFCNYFLRNLQKLHRPYKL